jgi:hypothetical protein
MNRWWHAMLIACLAVAEPTGQSSWTSIDWAAVEAETLRHFQALVRMDTSDLPAARNPRRTSHPPFAADRDGGYIYGRGTVDDKVNLTAGLMVMLLSPRPIIEAGVSTWRALSRP